MTKIILFFYSDNNVFHDVLSHWHLFILTETEVKALLVNDEIRQSLMAAPLWKYFALRGHEG